MTWKYLAHIFPPFEKWVYYMYMIKEMNLEQQLLD